MRYSPSEGLQQRHDSACGLENHFGITRVKEAFTSRGREPRRGSTHTLHRIQGSATAITKATDTQATRRLPCVQDKLTLFKRMRLEVSLQFRQIRENQRLITGLLSETEQGFYPLPAHFELSGVHVWIKVTIFTAPMPLTILKDGQCD